MISFVIWPSFVLNTGRENTPLHGWVTKLTMLVKITKPVATRIYIKSITKTVTIYIRYVINFVF